MSGRDPHEPARSATPLELFFDLTFVVAFGAAGNELAHAVTTNHVVDGVIAFMFCTFGICWAWINYTWFASAYDTDDWAFRLLTMVQMAGVIVFALGIPEVFTAIAEHDRLGNGVLVAGYVVMRVSMVGMWLRVRRDDPIRRRAATTYVVTVTASQLLWALLLVPDIPVRATLALAVIPIAIELAGPIIAERRHGGTPWHPHHVAERYGLLVIIALGEVIIGTVAAMSALVHDPDVGWSGPAVVVLVSGIVLTLGMWWSYFVLPWAELLHHHRERSFFWGYGHIAIFGAIAATGAGLHAAQYRLEDHSELGVIGTALTVVVPLAAFCFAVFAMYAVSMRAADPFHLALLGGTAGVMAAALVVAGSGGGLAASLALIALAPLVVVFGYETVGHAHVREHIERLRR